MVWDVSTMTWPASNCTGKVSRARGAGGFSTSPCRSKLEAWHRAKEAVLIRFPVDGAAEVGAAPVHGQKAAVVGANEVETAVWKLRHRPIYKAVNCARCDHTTELAFQATRLHEHEADAADFEQRQGAECAHAHFEKVAAGVFVFFRWICFRFHDLFSYEISKNTSLVGAGWRGQDFTEANSISPCRLAPA